MAVSTEKEMSDAIEDILDCIDDGLLEWGDICVLMDEHFPNGSIPDELQERLEELVSDQEVDITFDAERGWLYKELY
ncbi:hypothetical protein [Aeromonas sp. MrichA-1]|uniref:hypothetical protein n=1 Tax=Aeromonas sp. MrichA-1 TaxID=2823362 RepID=UPI001B322B9A|nr:hypothetical protein [Aeromonas sp. MrichA-1]MBP4081276.1 hypothetical protein [Aeromonas sp. MrichA-1]